MKHRIVSLIASATEIVCALGFEDRLVGRSHECDHPPSVAALPVCSTSKVEVGATGRTIDDQVRAIVADGLSVYRVEPDVLDRLAPTVVITQTQCEVCAVSLKDVEAAVCELVGSRPRIVSLEPMSLPDVWSDIRTVAAALDAPDRGEALVGRLVAALDSVHAVTAADGTRPSIGCIEWIDPLMAAGNWVPELVERAGGVDVLGKAGQHSGGLSIEALAAADPDVIAVMPCGWGIGRALRGPELGVERRVIPSHAVRRPPRTPAAAAALGFARQHRPRPRRAAADTTRPVGRTKPIHSRWASICEEALGHPLLQVQVDGVVAEHAGVLEDHRPDGGLAPPVGQLLVAPADAPEGVVLADVAFAGAAAVAAERPYRLSTRAQDARWRR